VPEKPTKSFSRAEILIRACGLHTAQEALELLEHVYPAREPLPKTRFFLEELFAQSGDD
jgi:hypothetical protein